MLKLHTTGHKHYSPKSIRQPGEVHAMMASKSHLASRLHFLLTQKKGPFHEHSPMLYDISSVPRWEKVNTGLLKMYLKEVLAKFPIVQHWHFDPLCFPWQKADLARRQIQLSE